MANVTRTIRGGAPGVSRPREHEGALDPGMTVEDREFRRWLMDIERRAILPLKWALLLGTIFIWHYARPMWPEVDVFVVFFVYASLIVASHYFFTFSKIPLAQARGFCYASYAIDLLYVTALAYLDSKHPRIPGVHMTEYYILYFLLLIRGFVLYRNALESVGVNVLISLLFVMSFWFQERMGGQESSLAFVFTRPFLLRLSLVWMVMLMAWFVFEIINRQKFELLRARERLYQGERLTALGELAAGVAHEINNPIGIISTYAEYLIRKADGTDANREDYEVIRSEAQRCKKIVGELLRFARPTESYREPADLRVINDEVLRFIFHDRTDRTIRVERHYPSALPWVHVDPVQVKQALLNIYVNAQQALGVDGGQIDISIAQVGRNHIEAVVADTGPGFAPEDLPRLFDPFFTRKPGGSGLGLAITRRLLEANDAEIEIASRRPHGALVRITFHALAPAPETAAAE